MTTIYPPTDFHICVSIGEQILELREGATVLKRYPVSTSRFGPGFEEGSYKTPLGSFRICEKFGEGKPLRTIFRSRQPIGILAPDQPCDDDLVMSRILRLEGLDPENANSYERFIYIHGTNHEDMIGHPASQGCVRMKNADVAELYDRVAEGTPVRISIK